MCFPCVPIVISLTEPAEAIAQAAWLVVACEQGLGPGVCIVPCLILATCYVIIRSHSFDGCGNRPHRLEPSQVGTIRLFFHLPHQPPSPQKERGQLSTWPWPGHVLGLTSELKLLSKGFRPRMPGNLLLTHGRLFSALQLNFIIVGYFPLCVGHSASGLKSNYHKADMHSPPPGLQLSRSFPDNATHIQAWDPCTSAPIRVKEDVYLASKQSSSIPTRTFAFSNLEKSIFLSVGYS